MRTGHMSLQRGASALVHMRNGDKIEGKFWKYEGKYVHLYGQPPIRTCKIRTVSYRKLKEEG